MAGHLQRHDLICFVWCKWSMEYQCFMEYLQHGWSIHAREFATCMEYLISAGLGDVLADSFEGLLRILRVSSLGDEPEVAEAGPVCAERAERLEGPPDTPAGNSLMPYAVGVPQSSGCPTCSGDAPPSGGAPRCGGAPPSGGAPRCGGAPPSGGAPRCGVLHPAEMLHSVSPLSLQVLGTLGLSCDISLGFAPSVCTMSPLHLGVGSLHCCTGHTSQVMCRGLHTA
jgi:hypothetical protein